MSRKSSKRVSFFTPDSTEKPTTIFLKHSPTTTHRKKIAVVGIFTFRIHPVRIWRFTPSCRLFRRLGAKLARALRFFSLPRRRRRRGKTTSTSPPARSMTVGEDSQRIEAIEDCIEFLNSSSSWCDSLSRSSSVSARTESCSVHL
ncbi:hypothetical protein LINPERPRIM_LOCUS25975 [Linum perenne]